MITVRKDAPQPRADMTPALWATVRDRAAPKVRAAIDAAPAALGLGWPTLAIALPRRLRGRVPG